jgi:DNA polymerase elongation subunit (family B)
MKRFCEKEKVKKSKEKIKILATSLFGDFSFSQ